MRDRVLFFSRDIHHADAATLLDLVFVRVRPLHVAALGEYEHRFLVRHEVLCGNILHAALYDPRAAVVAVFFRKLRELAFHYRKYLFRRREDLF